MPPDLRSWLPQNHEVWFIIELIESLDLSALEASYRLGSQGRSPLSPTMLLTLLVWGYSRGTVSSRAIERACVEDVTYRVICANDPPDHTTIARFRQRHEQAIAALFVQVLELCARVGLVRVGLVALDGTKMSANAALEANRLLEGLRAEVDALLAAAAAGDAADDEEYGPENSGSGLSKDLADPTRRSERLAELLAELDTTADNDTVASRINTTDPQSRIMHTADGGSTQGYNAQIVVGEGQVILAAQVTNESNDYHQLVPMLDAAQMNLAAIDHDEPLGVLLADAGYCSTDNFDALNKRKIDALIATTRRHKQASVSTDDIEPDQKAVAAYLSERADLDAQANAERHRRAAIFAAIEASGAALSDHLDELGISRHSAYTQRARWRQGGVGAIGVKHRATCLAKPKQPSPSQRARSAMAAKLAEPYNRKRYKQRSHLVETIFAQIKHNRGIRRFQRRGLSAVNAEWELHAMVHNITKLRLALTTPPQPFAPAMECRIFTTWSSRFALVT